jgi:hypothetical protein
MVSSVSDGDGAVTRHCKIINRKLMLSSQRSRQDCSRLPGNKSADFLVDLEA